MDIKELQAKIIAGGRAEERPKIDFDKDGSYRAIVDELQRHPPAGENDRRDLTKGLLLLENEMHLGSTTLFYPLYRNYILSAFGLEDDDALKDWILAHRNNEYVLDAPMHVKTAKELSLWRAEKAARPMKKLADDQEISRRAKARRKKIQLEHEERKRINDAKRARRLAGETE